MISLHINFQIKVTPSMSMDHMHAVLSAAERGDKKAMESYISEGKVNVSDEEGSTPLMYAAANGKEEIIRMLLDPDVRQLDHCFMFLFFVL